MTPTDPMTAPEPEADLALSGERLTRFGPAVGELTGLGAGALLAVLDEHRAPFPRRFAAATLLALVGDPRFVAREPDLVDIPGGPTVIGLETALVDQVTAAWAHVGVERDWIAKEAPAHPVDLEPSRIGRFPGTNAEYLEFVRAWPEAERPSSWPHGTFPWAAANHPRDLWTGAPTRLAANRLRARAIRDAACSRHRQICCICP